MQKFIAILATFIIVGMLSIPVFATETEVGEEPKKKLIIKPRITYESNLKSEELEQGNGVIAGTHNKIVNGEIVPIIYDDPVTSTTQKTSNEEKAQTKEESKEKTQEKNNNEMPVLIGLLGVISLTIMRGLRYRLKDHYEQAAKILKQGPGVWIPKEDRLKMLKLINSVSVTQYKITADGYLVPLGVLDRDSGKSYTISDQLNELIKGNRVTVLSFSNKVLKLDKKGRIYVDNVDYGITVGSVGTGKVIVLDDKDAQGNELGAVLAHELAHANATKDESEDHAIKVENAVREQLGIEKRQQTSVVDESTSYHYYDDDDYMQPILDKIAAATEKSVDIQNIDGDLLLEQYAEIVGRPLEPWEQAIPDIIEQTKSQTIYGIKDVDKYLQQVASNSKIILTDYFTDVKWDATNQKVVITAAGASFAIKPGTCGLEYSGGKWYAKAGEINNYTNTPTSAIDISSLNLVDISEYSTGSSTNTISDTTTTSGALAKEEAYLNDLYENVYWEKSSGTVVVNNGTTNLRLSEGDCGLKFVDGKSIVNTSELEEAFDNYRGAGEFNGIGEFFQDFENFSPSLSDFKVNAVDVKSHIASFGEPPSIVMGKEFPIEVSSANTNVLKVHIKNLDTGEKVTLEDKYVNAVDFYHWTKYKFEKEGNYEIYIEGVNTLDKGSSSTKNVATDIVKVKVVGSGSSEESSIASTYGPVTLDEYLKEQEELNKYRLSYIPIVGYYAANRSDEYLLDYYWEEYAELTKYSDQWIDANGKNDESAKKVITYKANLVRKEIAEKDKEYAKIREQGGYMSKGSYRSFEEQYQVNFENYMLEKYAGAPNITLFADKDKLGHVFIRLEYYEKDKSGKTKRNVIFKGFHPDEVGLDSVTFGGPSLLEDDISHIWDLAETFTISNQNAKDVIDNVIVRYEKEEDWGLLDVNCVDFGVESLSEAGVAHGYTKDLFASPHDIADEIEQEHREGKMYISHDEDGSLIENKSSGSSIWEKAISGTLPGY